MRAKAMGKKITRENRKFKFETLQLHVGQEKPDPENSGQETVG